MIYYFGPAVMHKRMIEIDLVEEKGSKKMVRYKLQTRVQFINKGRFIYIVGLLDCPRPLIKEIKSKKKDG